MTSWGYTLSSEEHPPRTLMANAERAEAVGFDFLSISDHYHPWVGEQGQSPFVWSTIGAVAARTSRIRLGVGVNCPILRIHPAIVAHAAATSACLLEGRFFLGVGTGEALNEHVLGQRWPNIETRREMLSEAVAVMRCLWTGDTVDHRGQHYTVENAKLFTVPDEAPPVVFSAFGEEAARLAAAEGDGIWGTSPQADLLEVFEAAGGKGMKVGQLSLCWGPDRDRAVELAHRVWPNTGIPGQLSQDLPTWTHFEQVAALVTPEAIADKLPCGPDPGPIRDAIAAYTDAGYDHVHLHQIGPDQEGFLSMWEREVVPRL
jgi:coenzyme F420-dependent glucose-6-phosphate dehydrogenase